VQYGYNAYLYWMWDLKSYFIVITDFYYRDGKVSLEQEVNMKTKQMQATKEEMKKIKGVLEEVCF